MGPGTPALAATANYVSHVRRYRFTSGIIPRNYARDSGGSHSQYACTRNLGSHRSLCSRSWFHIRPREDSGSRWSFSWNFTIVRSRGCDISMRKRSLTLARTIADARFRRSRFRSRSRRDFPGFLFLWSDWVQCPPLRRSVENFAKEGT